MKYILTKTPINKDEFVYEVKNSKGDVVSKRKSKKYYVACTIDGQFYFGRLDLVGKGDHGRQIKWCNENNRQPKEIAYLNNTWN